MMKKIKTKLLAVAMAAVVLCTGTVTANAACKNSGRVADHYVSGEIYAGKYPYSAYCRTVSSSYDVETEIHAWYGYYDPSSGAFYDVYGMNDGVYGCEVYFNAPSAEYIANYVSATHLAYCDGDFWKGETEIIFQAP